MPHTAIAPARAARLIHVLFAIQLVSMGAMEMSGPFWPVHLRSLSGPLFGFAGIAVYVGPMLGIMLTGAFWGRVGDRYGHKPMMIRALLGLSVTQLAIAFTDDVWTILALRFLQGACAGFIAPAQAYGVALAAPDQRARLFAWLQVSTNVGSLAGALVGGVILDYATFFWINATAAALCAASALAAWLILPGIPPAAKAAPVAAPAGQGGRTWRTAPIPGLLAILGMLLVSRMLTQTPFALYVRATFDVGNWVVGLCYGLLALGFILSATAWARHFEHKALPATLGRMAGVAAACAGLTALAGATRDIGVFIGAYFAWGVLLGATTPILMSQISKAAGGLRQGHVLGIAYSASQCASMGGIVLGGWLCQAAGLRYTYYFVAFFYVMAAVAALAMRRGAGAAVPAAQLPVSHRGRDC